MKAELIVAVGASGSDRSALRRFLEALDLGGRIAAVVVMQHREALDSEALAAFLAESGREISTPRHEEVIEPGRIYLPPADVITTVENGRFQLRPAAEAPGSRGTIDSFLVSLAQEEDGRSVAVMLAGTGGDGTLGFTAIKEAGGLTLAEMTGEDVADLANSMRPAALADFILRVPDLARKVVDYDTYLASQRGQADDANAAETASALMAIATVMRKKTGHDFHGYKQGTFLRRVHRRMQVVQAENLQQYVDIRKQQADEPQNLFNDLLIGVTQFFRDAREFEVLEGQVVPELFRGKGRGDQLRVWVVGCSTGEEAYSLGILLREHMAKLDDVPQIQIFATDIDGRALASARVGRYPLSIAENLSPERLARWFVREGETYCVVKELREMCIFSPHSVIKDAPFSRLDLISCRNLLIYLDAELQGRVIPLFHFALKPNGFLFLGNSENVSRHASLFAPVENRYRIFRRLDTGARALPDFPFTTVDRRQVLDLPPRPVRVVDAGLSRAAERVAERYTPAYIIVDENHNVLHFAGRTGPFIDPAGGVASLNLLNLIHPDLRLDLRAALSRAAGERTTVRIDGLLVPNGNGERKQIDLIVEPIQDPMAGRCFVVVFREGAVLGDTEGTMALSGSLQRDEQVQRLEAELRSANERLQATIEELESTNEELKSSNEEYQSLNEELQSANEELETSKEELQSINEELTTVNGELAHRVQELGRANSDLKNLLESTQIATIILDNELRVMNYTPAVTEVFHLVETDIGRPITHIKSRVAYEDLQDDARRVIRTLGSVSREIESTTGTRYIVRVLPYRSVDNFIGGAVVTFVDTTPLTRAQAALRDSELRLRTLMEGIPQLVWRSRPGGEWTWAGPQWERFTGLTDQQSQGRGWLQAVHPDDREIAVRAWAEAEAKGHLSAEYRVRRGSDGAFVWHHTRAVPVIQEGGHGEPREWLGTTTDVQQLKELQDSLNVLVAELQHRTRNLLAVVRAIGAQTIASSGSLEEFRFRFEDRLNALSRVQGILSRSERDGVPLGELLRLEFEALGPVDGEDKVLLDGPPVMLHSSAVQTLALAIHELATNARKYGALAAHDGRLKVTWTVAKADGADARLHLDWTEDGVDMRQVAPDRIGYGRELIEKALPYSLNARTRYEMRDRGIACSIELPLK